MYKLYNVYIAAIIIRLESVSVIIINIYNLVGNKKVIIIERSMKLALDKAERKIILFNNFNAHHSVWGGRAAAIKI